MNIKKIEERYESIYGKEPVQGNTILEIENILGVKLPTSFKEISKFYSGGLLGGISHYEIAIKGMADNLLRRTLELRKEINLSHRYLVLAEPPESIILLDTISQPEVFWCNSEFVYDIVKYDMSHFDTWRDYADFFLYLLNEEV